MKEVGLLLICILKRKLGASFSNCIEKNPQVKFGKCTARGGYSQKIGWGCAARSPKLLPYL